MAKKSGVVKAFASLVAFLPLCALSLSPIGGSSAFTYNNESFLLHGKPFQIIGGQMDPQRVPRPYWRQRLQMARAMGLNTIFSYMFWNNFEASPGQWDFEGQNDVAEYFRIAQDEGLHIVLRPGPYICGEHEWGGFPAWLSQIPGMEVRENNGPFLDASRTYISQLAQQLRPLQITQGGPILMAQLENEYGSFGSDKAYLSALASILRDNFDLILYTNDGGTQTDVQGGHLHGVLSETDGSPQTGFAARDKYITDSTSLGPQLDGEYYVTWLDVWASNYTYETDVGNPSAIQQVQSDLDWILSNNGSFSLYMFHGGTNFGFENGAIWGSSYLEAVTSSYDYGAPLDESGRPTEVYYKIRETISGHVPKGGIPDVPTSVSLTSVPTMDLKPLSGLFEAQNLGHPRIESYPMTMEALGQSYGFVLYEHTMTQSVNGTLAPGDGPRDRVIVYVNEERVGVIDLTYTTPATVTLSLKKGDVLQLLVENLGRIDYAQQLREQLKGVVGNISVGDTTLSGWKMYSLPLSSTPGSDGWDSRSSGAPVGETPYFYTGSFKTSGSPGLGQDTFLEIPNGIKGVAWVNGVKLGRYWTVGPQQSLYVPGCFLKEGENEVVVLELEPSANMTMSAVGVSKRTWGNNPDPDAP